MEGLGRTVPYSEYRRRKFKATKVENVLVSEEGDIAVTRSANFQIQPVVIYSRTYPRVQRLRFRRLLMQTAIKHPNQVSFEFRLLPEEIQSFLHERELRVHPDYLISATTLVQVGPMVSTTLTVDQRSFDLKRGLGSNSDPEGRELALGGARLVQNSAEVARRRELGSRTQPTSAFQCTVEFPRGAANLERQLAICQPLLDRYVSLENETIVNEYRSWIASNPAVCSEQFKSLFRVFDYKSLSSMQVGAPSFYKQLRDDLFDYAETVRGGMEDNVGDLLNRGSLSSGLEFTVNYCSFDSGVGNLLERMKRIRSFHVSIGD